MTPRSISPTPHASAPKPSFNIFQDEARPPNEEPRADTNENVDPGRGQGSKYLHFDEDPSSKMDAVLRAPLADVTQVVVRPQLLLSALAEIARLRNELEASKGENKALKDRNRV